MEWLSPTLAIAAFVLALANGYFNLQNHRRQDRAEERAKKAEQRADLIEQRAAAAEQRAVAAEERALEQERPEFELEMRQHVGREIAWIIVRNIGGGPAMKLRGHLRGDKERHFGMKDSAAGPIRPTQTFAFAVNDVAFPKEGGRPRFLGEEGQRDVVLDWEDKRGKPFSQVFTQAEIQGRDPVEDTKMPSTWESAYHGRAIE